MELVRGLHNISQRHRGCVLTVGNYDGVHLGHQQMIGVLKARAGQLRSVATVLVFEPSSKEFIDPDGAPPRLTRWREKFLALAAHGVERLVTLRFDECMRAMTPRAFVEDLIVERLGTRHMVVGDELRYGSNACGTIETLRAAGEQHGRARTPGARRLPRSCAPAGAAVPDDGPRGAWPALGPLARVSDREPEGDAPQAAGVGHLGGVGSWNRCASSSGCRESGHAAHGERGRALARSVCIR